MTGEPLVAVTMVLGTFAADTIKGALEAAGIPAMTRGEQHGSWLFAGSGGGLGLVQVLVEADRLDEAREVLAGLEQEDEGADVDDGDDAGEGDAGEGEPADPAR